MSNFPTSVIIMPSENTFKRHADTARTALKTFNAVSTHKDFDVVKDNLIKLVDAAVCLISP
jgi:hypothetical protein